jgi:hypothetical protein
MNLNTLSNIARKSCGVIAKNSPTILTFAAIGGLFTTVIFAVRATPKAERLISNEYKRRSEDYTFKERYSGTVPDLTKKEVVKLTWKLYIPATCMGAATIACIVGSNSINQKRNAALATVYGLTEASFREYREKVVETIGKSKELKLRDEIATGDVLKNPPDDQNIIRTGHGDTLCKDKLSGRYFRSDIEYVRRAINELNHTLLSETWVSVNDLYYELGLEDIEFGKDEGWSSDSGLVEVSFTSALTPKGEPCLVLTYPIRPKYI